MKLLEPSARVIPGLRGGGFCLLLAIASLPGTSGQDTPEPTAPGAGLHDHGAEGAPYDPRDYTPEERQRIERLFGMVICACPTESWTKTLSGCPAGCADEQKTAIRRAVKAGKTDEQIFEAQVKSAGTREVLSIPDSWLANLFPFLVLAALASVVVLVLTVSVRRRPPPELTPEKAQISRENREDRKVLEDREDREDSEVQAAVERDLEEMDR